MPCYFDARDVVKWETITITLDMDGSYSGGGTGTLSGSSTLVLTRGTLDQTLAPDEGQLVGEQFKTMHQRRGRPVFLLPGETEGTGSFTLTSGVGSETVAGSFLLRLFPQPEHDNEECDFVEPRALVLELVGVGLFLYSDRFQTGLDIYHDRDIDIDPIYMLFEGDSYTTTLEYDIMGNFPPVVIGTGTNTLTITCA